MLAERLLKRRRDLRPPIDIESMPLRSGAAPAPSARYRSTWCLLLAAGMCAFIIHRCPKISRDGFIATAGPSGVGSRTHNRPGTGPRRPPNFGPKTLGKAWKPDSVQASLDQIRREYASRAISQLVQYYGGDSAWLELVEVSLSKVVLWGELQLDSRGTGPSIDEIPDNYLFKHLGKQSVVVKLAPHVDMDCFMERKTRSIEEDLGDLRRMGDAFDPGCNGRSVAHLIRACSESELLQNILFDIAARWLSRSRPSDAPPRIIELPANTFKPSWQRRLPQKVSESELIYVARMYHSVARCLRNVTFTPDGLPKHIVFSYSGAMMTSKAFDVPLEYSTATTFHALILNEQVSRPGGKFTPRRFADTHTEQFTTNGLKWGQGVGVTIVDTDMTSLCEDNRGCFPPEHDKNHIFLPKRFLFFHIAMHIARLSSHHVSADTSVEKYVAERTGLPMQGDFENITNMALAHGLPAVAAHARANIKNAFPVEYSHFQHGTPGSGASTPTQRAVDFYLGMVDSLTHDVELQRVVAWARRIILGYSKKGRAAEPENLVIARALWCEDALADPKIIKETRRQFSEEWKEALAFYGGENSLCNPIN